MSIKTLSVPMLFEPGMSVEPLMEHAAALAAGGAHLTVMLGLPDLVVPVGVMFSGIDSMVIETNTKRKNDADAVLSRARAMMDRNGVSGEAILYTGSYTALAARLAYEARATDAVLMQRADAGGLELDLIESMLFQAGRPIILAPDKAPPKQFRSIVLAWDGGARAARAASDLQRVAEPGAAIEILGVSGEKDHVKNVDGASIARSLARHGFNVTCTMLAADGQVANIILDHAMSKRADLLAMGGYGHSRLREMVLGGVTRAMIASAPLPVMMSY